MEFSKYYQIDTSNIWRKLEEPLDRDPYWAEFVNGFDGMSESLAKKLHEYAVKKQGKIFLNFSHLHVSFSGSFAELELNMGNYPATVLWRMFLQYFR